MTLTLPDSAGDAEEVAHFKAPLIQDNVTGWGPCDMPEQFKDMPYQPFSKGDRLGKVRLLTYVHYLNYFCNGILLGYF